MFVMGTATMVAYVPTDQMDLIGPLPQVLRIGFGPFGIAGPLVTIAILMTLASRMAQASVSFTAVTRLPMVAGWDRMLPAWFSKLHSKYRTPVNSIMLVGAAAFTMTVLSNIGVGQAEAYQLLFNASQTLYALTYVVMFAIPIWGLRGVTPRPPLWLKVASMSGLLMTLLNIVLSVVPIIEVKSVADVRIQDLGDDLADESRRCRDSRRSAETRGSLEIISRASRSRGQHQQNRNERREYRRDREDINPCDNRQRGIAGQRSSTVLLMEDCRFALTNLVSPRISPPVVTHSVPIE